MNSAEFNAWACGRIWNLPDIPVGFPGRKLLEVMDDGDGILEPFEIPQVDWKSFSQTVLEFQVAHRLYVDGKLGEKSLPVLQDAYDVKPLGALLSWPNLTLYPATVPTAPPPPGFEITTQAKTEYERRLAGLWNAYGGAIMKEAVPLGISVKAAIAVFSVEVGQFARGWDPRTGRVIIRFENQTVWAAKYRMPPVGNTHKGQSAEWEALKTAYGIDPEKALASVSYGLCQLMGFHAGVPFANGWSSPVSRHRDIFEFVFAFQDSGIEQVGGFFDYVRANRMISFFVNKDWDKIVRVYNGATPTGKTASIYQQYVNGLTLAYKTLDKMALLGARFE